ncbi:hypothetical protein I6N95_08840 [Vagococcus sp. BWB3-3]|uniref:Uncharacterized protein n=1 Tax=Vagococcus allomyrinae TaxID=2794353 RepID=A0A940PE19_9ENTE|nr:hypothetical protein [Vagococcus allomyrinae]MBP1041108.1 hypothetical protein [Vagococcus allomyrinae]
MDHQRTLLTTPLGELYLRSNHPFDYAFKEIFNRDYRVTRRYEVKVTLKETSDTQFIECGVSAQGEKLSSGPSLGQNLAALQIEGGVTNMHIGTFGDVEGQTDHYLTHALRIQGEPNSRFQEFVFYVAWLTFKEAINIDNMETWLAVDPYLEWYYEDQNLHLQS